MLHTPALTSTCAWASHKPLSCLHQQRAFCKLSKPVLILFPVLLSCRLGPFGSAPDTSGRPAGASATEGLLPATMYVDTRGAMHLGLDSQEHAKLVRALQQAQEEAGMLHSSTAALEAAADAATAKMAAELLAVRRMQARAMQARMLEDAPAAQRTPSACSVRRMHHINQPRRMN